MTRPVTLPKLWLRCSLALLLALVTPVQHLLACTVSQFELTEKEELPRYTVLLFYNPGTKDNDESLDTLKALSKKWSKRTNVDFEAFDVSTKRGGKIAKYWQVKEFPVTYVLAPTGWCLATFKGKLAAKQVDVLMTSPGKAALMDALKKNKAVFLVLGNKKMKGHAASLKAAKGAAKAVNVAMKIKVGTVVVDPTDQREAKLLQNLGLEKPPKESRVYVTFGKGRAVLQEVEAEDTEERLAFTIQLLATADQCGGFGMEVRGEPLLLGK